MSQVENKLPSTTVLEQLNERLKTAYQDFTDQIYLSLPLFMDTVIQRIYAQFLELDTSLLEREAAFHQLRRIGETIHFDQHSHASQSQLERTLAPHAQLLLSYYQSDTKRIQFINWITAQNHGTASPYDRVVGVDQALQKVAQRKSFELTSRVGLVWTPEAQDLLVAYFYFETLTHFSNLALNIKQALK